MSYINALEGNFVQKGQELFKIESLEFGNMVAEYLQAIAEEKFQTSRVARLKQLVETKQLVRKVNWTGRNLTFRECRLQQLPPIQS